MTLCAVSSFADSLTVGNPSFETPAPVGTVSPYQFAPFVPWQVTETGLQTGRFTNVAGGPLIDNVPEGEQVAFMLEGPGITLFQDVASTIVALGQQYKFTIAAGASTGTTSDATLQLTLYYVDGATRVPLKTFSKPFNLAENPNGITHLYDVSVTSDVIAPGSPAIGKQLGIMVATPGVGNGNAAYWDLDNARLDAVPEPSSLLLLAFAAGGLGWRRRRATTAP